MEKIIYENRNKKEAGVSILILDNIDFKMKTWIRKRRALHNDRGVNWRRGNNIYKCTLNKWAPEHIKQIWKDIKGEIDNSTIICRQIGQSRRNVYISRNI